MNWDFLRFWIQMLDFNIVSILPLIMSSDEHELLLIHICYIQVVKESKCNYCVILEIENNMSLAHYDASNFTLSPKKKIICSQFEK